MHEDPMSDEKQKNQNDNKRRICPHDRYIKLVLEDPKIAADFFRQHLPMSVQNKIDFSTLKAQKESFIDKELEMRVTDILFSVDFEKRSISA